MPKPMTWDDDEQIIADLLKRMRRLEARHATQGPIWLPSDGFDPDSFTITGAGDLDHTLTYLPLGLDRVTLNGTNLAYTTDFTVDWATGVLSLVNAPTASDVLEVWYVTTGELIAASLPADTGIIPLTTPTLAADVTDVASGGGTVTKTGITGTGNAEWVVFVGWITGGNDSATLTVTDDQGNTYLKADEVVVDNTGNPDTFGMAAFTTKLGASPATTAITVHGLPSGAYTGVFVVEVPDSHDTANSDADSGMNVSSTTTTVGTPTADEGVVVAHLNWPHKTITWDTGYTQLASHIPPGGPYSQGYNFGCAYDITSPGASQTVTNSAGADSVTIAVVVTPDAA